MTSRHLRSFCETVYHHIRIARLAIYHITRLYITGEMLNTVDDHAQEPADSADLSSPLIWTPEHNSYTLSVHAVENGSIIELKKSLALARIFLPKFDTDYVQFRDEVFRDVLIHHSITLLTYMLDHERVPVSLATPNSIF
ncbi:hypothetical protein F4819DRAFT_478296 [Hypoxylon fuscum]|nr:hypothetical protein F4819DRAFT_478296 [Hypoxylon fuscum]